MSESLSDVMDTAIWFQVNVLLFGMCCGELEDRSEELAKEELIALAKKNEVNGSVDRKELAKAVLLRALEFCEGKS